MGIKNEKNKKIKKIIELWKENISFLEKIKILLREVNILRQLKGKYEYKKRNKYLLAKGEEVLSKVDSIFRKVGIEYWLDYGTFLGVVRDKDFIEYDDDIDIGIILPTSEKKHQELRELFIKEGFKKKYIFYVEDRIAIEKYQFEKITVDIFNYIIIDKKEIIETFTGVSKTSGKYEVWSCKNIYSGVIRQKFKNIEVNVMKNSDLYLKNCYGENYQEKIKNFDWRKLESYKLTNYKYKRIFFDKNRGIKE